MQALECGDPRVIGRCQVLARIGAGGMAVVYLGRSSDGWPVAIKVMHAEFAADPELRDRFRREVAANRIVSGGYTTAVLDADPDARRAFDALDRTARYQVILPLLRAVTPDGRRARLGKALDALRAAGAPPA